MSSEDTIVEDTQTESAPIKYTNLVNMAKEKAMKAHKGQKRKIGGGDYYNEHILPVAKSVTDYLENHHNAYKINRHFADLILKPYHQHKIILSTKLDESPIVEQIIAAAYLHDVLEDTAETIDEFPNITKQLVETLTKQPGENYYDFIIRIMDSPLTEFAVIIKLADIQNNMKTLDEGQLKDKYRLAQHILKNQ